MSEKFEPKFIEESGYCEKIQSAKKCSLCYFNRDMNCTFHQYTKERQDSFSRIIRDSQMTPSMTMKGR